MGHPVVTSVCVFRSFVPLNLKLTCTHRWFPRRPLPTTAATSKNKTTSTETNNNNINVAVLPRDALAWVPRIRDGLHHVQVTDPMAWLLVLQALALVGAAVGGVLARNRRKSLMEANEKLRRINEGLRARSSAGYSMSSIEDIDGDTKSDEEDAALIKQALEKSLGGPSAAHPNESYGASGGATLSLAQARRAIDASIRDTKLKLQPILKSSNYNDRINKNEMEDVVESLNQALQLAMDIKDPWAERVLIRLRAKAQRLAGNTRAALVDLQDVLNRVRQQDNRQDHLSVGIESVQAEAADVLGELGDVLTELGEYEAAGKAYDDCLAAMDEVEEQAV